MPNHKKKPDYTLPTWSQDDIRHSDELLYSGFAVSRLGLREEHYGLVPIIKAKEHMNQLLQASAQAWEEKYGGPQVVRNKSGDLFVHIHLLEEERDELLSALRKAMASSPPSAPVAVRSAHVSRKRNAHAKES